MNEITNTMLEKRNKEHYEKFKVAKTLINSLMEKIELKPLRLKRDKQGTRTIKFGPHSG